MRTFALAISLALLPWWAFTATPNQAPIFTPIALQTVNENQDLIVDISVTDPEGGGLVLTISALPANASFVDNGDGTGVLQFNPNFEQAGDVTITVTATDNDALPLATSLDVDITVNNVNRAPIINAQGSIAAQVGQTVTASFAALDPDGDAVLFSGENLPGNMTVTNQGGSGAIVEFTPTEAEVGRFTVFINADDGTQSSAIPLDVKVEALPVIAEGCSVSPSGTPSTVLCWGFLFGAWLLRRRHKR
jgi:MYXO-CTERM domain-containing protein